MVIASGALNVNAGASGSVVSNGQSGAAASGANGVATTHSANAFTQNFTRNLTNNLAGAMVDSAINNKPLNADTVANALKSSLITSGMASGANAIGDAAAQGDINAFTQKVAHAVLGCAGGAAMNAVVNNFLIQYKLKGMSSAYVDDEFAPKLEKWIELAKSKGVEITFNEAFRSTEYQASLSKNPFAITPARPGSSLHEAGFAVDINFERLSDIPNGLSKKEQQEILLETAKQAGLNWGGNFNKPDFPHFYFDPGSRTQKILEAQTTFCNLTKKCER